MNIYGVIFSITLVAAGVTLYFAGKFLKPNPFIGFRIGPTFTDKRVWKKVNCEAGVAFLGFGSVIALLALLDVRAGVIIAFSITGILFITLCFIWRAYRLAEYYTTMSPPEISKEKPIMLPGISVGQIRTLLAVLPPLLVITAFLVAYASLPAEVAVHFDVNEVPDRFENLSYFTCFTTPLMTLLSSMGLLALIAAKKIPILVYNPWIRFSEFFKLVFDILVTVSWMICISYVAIIAYNVTGQHPVPLNLIIIPLMALLALLTMRLAYRYVKAIRRKSFVRIMK